MLIEFIKSRLIGHEVVQPGDIRDLADAVAKIYLSNGNARIPEAPEQNHKPTLERAIARKRVNKAVCVKED